MDWHSIGNLVNEKFTAKYYETTKEETIRFWKTVAERYKDEPQVAMYELFNEPTINGQCAGATWTQWKELQEQIRRLSLAGSVVLGREESDMASVYGSASVLALSSRYEGLPMVLLECQAFGVPAVSFDCQCGPREIIDDGKTGFLVEEGDIPALAKALEKLMQDPALRKEMGLNAFRKAKQWSPENIMPQWIRLFEEIL